MFMVAWEGKAPKDRAEWMEILQAVFAGAAGTHRLRFHPGPNGWWFELESRDDMALEDSEMVANGPDTIRFNIAVALRERGKPIDPDWDQHGRVSQESR
jgi:hypothetical protein